MKKILFLLLLGVISVTKVHAFQNYQAGNLLLGIGIGAGSRSAYPIGPPQFSIHPSAEVIFGAWEPQGVGIALGFTIDSSINFLNSFTSSLAPMLTLHTTLLPRFDWYISLGLGMQFVSTSFSSGHYDAHVGFGTGFNIVAASFAIWNIGMAIHADQIFGSTGIKFLFGDVTHLTKKKQ